MSLATELRTRAEEALDRTTTTITGLAGELRGINVNDVTARARGIVTAVPSVDVQKLVDTVDGYRKAAQDQVDGLLHVDPRVGRVTDTVEEYGKAAAGQVEALVDQVRQDPRVAKVVETVDERLVKPTRARFGGADLEHKQVVKADPEAPVEVKASPVKPARKAPARKTSANA